MDIKGSTIAVTGAARGIGEGLVRRFVKEGASAIAVADLDLDAAAALCAGLAGSGTHLLPLAANAGDEAALTAMLERAEDELGPLDLVCSNAGAASGKGLDASDGHWERNWRLNVLSHVYAARFMVPRMLERGGGYLLNTCSGAGLLANADAPYMVTKHAAVAFADWLAIRYRHEGLKVSALCPRGVKTTMLNKALAAGSAAAKAVLAGGDVLEPAQVADAVVRGLAEERFLILPHADVADAIVHKASVRELWQDEIADLFAGARA